MSRQPPPLTCAICGADIPRNAHACPECGADDRTGWREQDYTDGLDLPDSEDTAETYQRYLRTQDIYEGRQSAKRKFWWAIALGLLVLFTIGIIIWR